MLNSHILTVILCCAGCVIWLVALVLGVKRKRSIDWPATLLMISGLTLLSVDTIVRVIFRPYSGSPLDRISQNLDVLACILVIYAALRLFLWQRGMNNVKPR
jgi:hypothetical protein